MLSDDIFSIINTTTVLNNTVARYVLFFGTFLFLLGFFQILQTLILRRVALLIRKTKTNLDDIAVKILETIKPPFYSFIAFYIALRALTITGSAKTVITVVLVVWVTVQVILALQVALDFAVAKRMRIEEDGSRRAMLEFLKGMGGWCCGWLVFCLSYPTLG
jgi:hypothetical protein